MSIWGGSESSSLGAGLTIVVAGIFVRVEIVLGVLRMRRKGLFRVASSNDAKGGSVVWHTNAAS